MTVTPTTTQPDASRRSSLTKWGIAVSLAALPLPLLVFAALIIGTVLRRRGEIDPGRGVMLLGTGCAILGTFLLVILLGLT
jgi:hypothetical protein